MLFRTQVVIGEQQFNIADNFTLASPVINAHINGSQEIFQVQLNYSALSLVALSLSLCIFLCNLTVALMCFWLDFFLLLHALKMLLFTNQLTYILRSVYLSYAALSRVTSHHFDTNWVATVVTTAGVLQMDASACFITWLNLSTWYVSVIAISAATFANCLFVLVICIDLGFCSTYLLSM